MDESPEIPDPPPEVPTGKIWSSLGIPPFITGLGTIIVAGEGQGGLAILIMLPVGLIAIIACLVVFIRAFRVRYHGRTLVLTSIGYFLGQIILCFCLWYGYCLAVVR